MALAVGLAALIWFGPPWGVALAVILAGVVAVIEYVRVAIDGARWWQWVLLIDGAVLMPVAAWFAVGFSLIFMTVLLVLAVLGAVVTYRSDGRFFDTIGRVVMGFLWVVLPLTLIVGLRLCENGVNPFRERGWVIFVFVVVIATDVGAYYVGRFLGRRPLCPELSPKKTRAGALGGLLAGVAGGVVVGLILLENISPVRAGILAALTSVAAQVGDLLASGLKREAGVKDFGRLLPGHGGLLDRIDGLLLAVPVVYAGAVVLLSME